MYPSNYCTRSFSASALQHCTHANMSPNANIYISVRLLVILILYLSDDKYVRL